MGANGSIKVWPELSDRIVKSAETIRMIAAARDPDHRPDLCFTSEPAGYTFRALCRFLYTAAGFQSNLSVFSGSGQEWPEN
jgi:hypothetical protein